MENSQGNGSTNEFKTRLVPAGRFSNAWIAPAVVAVIVVLGLAYMFQDSLMSSLGMADHKAAADVAAPASSPINPTPSAAPVAPAATPKP